MTDNLSTTSYIPKWGVEVGEYAGEGYWYDYPPLTFDTESEAIAFADSQTSAGNKVRRIWRF